MTIQEWGAIGEIIGGVAVVASLVYLAMQIRQNTRQVSLSMKATDLAAFERNVASGNRVRKMFILSPEITGLYMRGLSHSRDLSDAEKLRFDMILSNVFSEFQGAYVRHLTYRHDPADFAGGRRALGQLIRRSGVRDWLQRSEPDWRPEFAALVEELMRLHDTQEAEQAVKN